MYLLVSLYGGIMTQRKVYTDHVFSTRREAEKYVEDNYSEEKNYTMRNAVKAGKKVSVGVEKRTRGASSDMSFIIVIYVG
jgi:hypothetical protein